MLTAEQILNFKKNGYLVVPNFAEIPFCESVIEFAQSELEKQVAPIEYEADKNYPGAPASRTAVGGTTARRLLGALNRDPMLADWATGDSLRVILYQLLGREVYLSQSHHNCIMTKQPEFSSMTGWHRDNRYWHFERPDLVSAWLALTEETAENGCLWVLPTSHKFEIEDYQLDKNQFLRMDFARNKDLFERATLVPLNQGDLLLLHSNLFHAAGRNTTEATNFSMVFTYRAGDNPPTPASRSTLKEDILIS